MENLRFIPDLIFTPANKPERFKKAVDIGASAIIVDLEDGVAAKDKDMARKNAIAYLSGKTDQAIANIIRINPMATQTGLTDLLALAQSKLNLTALIYPKSESSQEINLISKILAEKHNNLPIIPLIESGKGVSQLENIVEQSQNIAGLMFGAADYAVDINSAISMEALYLARMRIVQAASTKKLACFDSPYFDFQDDAGLLDETKRIKNLGFTGKAAIHPKQIALIRQSFKPTADEHQEAQAMIALYESVKGEACKYKGKMIDVPVYEKAKQIVKIYNQLS